MKQLLLTLALILSFTITNSQSLDLICPTNVEQGTDDGVCTAVVDNLLPEIISNNPIAALIWTVEGVNTSDQSELCGMNDISGYTFIGNLSGLSTVTYTVIDIFGNAASCSFTVNISDDEAPQYTVPDPCDTLIFPGSIDCIFPDFESVPPLYNQPGTAVADIVFNTMTDNCLSPDVAPWYGPTMTSGTLDEGEDWITYSFTAYDDEFNSNTQEITFHWDGTVGIHEIYKDPLYVFPNPSTGEFTCNRPYKLYTLWGIEVEEGMELSPGIYLVVTDIGTRRLIINKF